MDLLNSGRKFLMLAPMSGFSNSACRQISREYGADACVAEFVYSRAVLSCADAVMKKLAFKECERPFGIQIFGSDEFEMADAAQLVEQKLAPDFIDINFGCPAQNAVGAGAGSALLKNVLQMKKIVRAMSCSVKIPVTVKMRTGWNSDSIILPAAALEMQESGAKMLTIHGRTKTQSYEGDADWCLIEKTAAALSISVVGNGSAEKLSPHFLRSSACAGFMIGRAALGNPWIFTQMRAKLSGTDSVENNVSASDRARLALRYAELVCGQTADAPHENFLRSKVQIMRFLKGCAGFKKVRVSMRDISSFSQLKELLCQYV